jgi:hypothetical protein
MKNFHRKGRNPLLYLKVHTKLHPIFFSQDKIHTLEKQVPLIMSVDSDII